MDFKVEGTCNTKTYCQSPWFATKKNFWILDALQWLKQPSNSFYFETLSFFLCFSFFFLLCKKVGGHALPRPSFPSVVGPDYIPKGQHGIEFWRPWNAKMKYTNGYSSKSRWEKRSHLFSYHVYSGSFMVIKMSKMVHFLYFLWITVKCLSSMFKCTWKILLISFRKW